MSISRSAEWPLVMMSAARMNIGTATSAAGRMPAIICWTMISGPMGRKKKNPTSVAMSSGTIIGNPRSRRTTMVESIAVAMDFLWSERAAADV